MRAGQGEALTRQACRSNPPDSSMGASAGFQATACTLSEWWVSVWDTCCVDTSHTLTLLSAATGQRAERREAVSGWALHQPRASAAQKEQHQAGAIQQSLAPVVCHT